MINTNNNLAVRYVWLLYLKLQDQVFFAISKQSKTSIFRTDLAGLHVGVEMARTVGPHRVFSQVGSE